MSSRCAAQAQPDQSLADRFDCARQQVLAAIRLREIKDINDLHNCFFNAYRQFTIEEFFDLVRQRMCWLESVALSNRTPETYLKGEVHSEVGAIFEAMRYIRTEDYWCDVLRELEEPSNTWLDLIAIIENMEQGSLHPPERDLELFLALQKIYKKESQPVEVRVCALDKAVEILSNEYNDILEHYYYEENPFPDPQGLNIGPRLVPAATGALKPVEADLCALLEDIVALYRATNAPELKEALEKAVGTLAMFWPGSGGYVRAIGELRWNDLRREIEAGNRRSGIG
jgi:hypothetical protein